MITQEEHVAKLEKAKRLLEEHEIRKGLKGKLYYGYPKIFEGLFELLSIPESVEFFYCLAMHTAERGLQDYPGDRNEIKINWWEEPNINYWLLVQEIFDDYWAAFLCFQHGFTKQAVEILRNTFELATRMYYMRFCNGLQDEAINKWLRGEKVVMNMDSMIKSVRENESLKDEGISCHLEQLWKLLCTATHSHKKMMTSMTVPGGMWVKEKMMFEPFIVLQTRSIFLWVVETELKMLQYFFKQDKETGFTQKILSTTTKMGMQLTRYSTVIGACPINPWSESGAAPSPDSGNDFVGQAHRKH